LTPHEREFVEQRLTEERAALAQVCPHKRQRRLEACLLAVRDSPAPTGLSD
jgi:hypothetical protein